MNPEPNVAVSRSWLRRFGSRLLGYRYAVAAGDQVAISLFNFAVSFTLVHLLSAPQFGTYGLWIAAANLAIGLQSALVCTPLGVHAPAQPDENQRQRLEDALGTVNLLFVGFVCVTAVGVVLLSEAEWIPADIVTKIAIPAYIAAELYREYYRSLAFGRYDMVLLLMVDAPYIVITTTFIGAMLLWPQHLATLSLLFIGLTLGGVAGRLCASLRIRVRLLRRGWVDMYRGICGESMWMVAGVVSTHVQGRCYAYVTTGLVGLAELAALNAVGLLLRPAQTLLVAWCRSSLPQLASSWSAGEIGAFDRRLLAALTMTTVGVGIWCACLWLGWGVIDRYFLGSKYPQAMVLLWPWVIVAALQGISTILANGLQAIREFRYLAYVTMLSAPLSLAATIGLTMWHGYTWTMYGLAAGHALNVAMMAAHLFYLRRRVYDRPVHTAAGSEVHTALP